MQRPYILRFNDKPTYQCARCERWNIHVADAPLCHECLEEDAMPHALSPVYNERRRSIAWGKKHKCQNCNAPLPVYRQVFCTYCRPHGAEGCNEDELADGPCNMEKKRLFRIQAVQATSKRCCHCKQVKPLKDFCGSIARADFRADECKQCHRERGKKKENEAA